MQGACLTIEFVATSSGLSGGLIEQKVDPDLLQWFTRTNPIFLGCSDTDPHIPEERVHETAAVLKKLEGNVNEKIHPGMVHTVNRDEIRQINGILDRI